MLNLSFAGTCGADPEIRAAGGGVVAKFRVAVNGYDRAKKEKTTTWLSVTVWGKRGEQLAALVSKGSRVAGSGQFEVREYTTRDGEVRTSYDVTVQDLTLLGGGAGSGAAASSRPAKRHPDPEAEFPGDDDIPF